MLFFSRKIQNFFTFLFFLTPFLSFTLFTPSVHSAIIKKQKSKKILILIEDGDDLKVGDELYVIDEDKQRKAIVEITKIRNNKAICKIKKGITQKGWTLVLKSEYSKDSKNKSSKKKRKTFRFSNQRFLLGILGGYSLFNLTIKPRNSESSKMSGQGYLAKGTLHYRLFHSLYANTGVGYKTFFVKSSVKHCTTKSDTVAPCETSIGYITADIRGQFVFFRNYRFRPWIGGGFDFYFPFSKESAEPRKNSQGTSIGSSYIAKDSITNLGIPLATAGLDISFTKKITLSITFEYGFFPSSTTITGNHMSLSAGLLF